MRIGGSSKIARTAEDEVRLNFLYGSGFASLGCLRESAVRQLHPSTGVNVAGAHAEPIAEYLTGMRSSPLDAA